MFLHFTFDKYVIAILIEVTDRYLHPIVFFMFLVRDKYSRLSHLPKNRKVTSNGEIFLLSMLKYWYENSIAELFVWLALIFGSECLLNHHAAKFQCKNKLIEMVNYFEDLGLTMASPDAYTILQKRFKSGYKIWIQNG